MAGWISLYFYWAAVVWGYRAVRAFQALRENPEIKPSSSPAFAPLVSVLIPAKNEEINLEKCVKSLLAQDYPAFEIIVINDHSIDRTGEILAELLRTFPDKIRAAPPSPTPAGWTGKNWALFQGVPLARGPWLLFTDADTRHEPWALSSALSHAESKGIDLLTLSPRCLAEGFWEQVIQPSAMALMGFWFPFAKVNDPCSSLVFGNGQYLLIRKKIYEAIGTHEKVRHALLEDFAMVKEAKRMSFHVECAIGTKIYGTRMYRSLETIWLGWRRIFLHAFRKNPAVMAKKAVSLLLFSVIPVLVFPFLCVEALQNGGYGSIAWMLDLLILAALLITAWKSYGVVGAAGPYGLLHPLAAVFLSGIFFHAAWTAVLGKEVRWR